MINANLQSDYSNICDDYNTNNNGTIDSSLDSFSNSQNNE